MLTKRLVEDVTKSLNDVNFMGFESRIKKLILTLLENPVKQMHEQEKSIVELTDTNRRVNRRMLETEFIMQKFQKAVAVVDTFSNKIVGLEAEMRGIEKAHVGRFKELEFQIQTDIPDAMDVLRRDQNAWKDRFDKL